MAINNENYDGIEEKQPIKGKDTAFWEGLWAMFSSMKTAIVLIIILAAASIVGTIIAQNAPEQDYIANYGATKYNLMKNLGLTHVYSSGWYNFLLFLVGVNLTVCSLNRFKMVLRQTKNPKVIMPADRISKMPKSERISSRYSTSDTIIKANEALRSGGYKVISERDGGDEVIYAAKGNIGLWGPYLTHLSLLVIFIGAIFGSLGGFHGFTAINEGESAGTYMPEGTEHSANLGFKIGLKSFRITYDKAHNPTGYKSDLSIYEGDKVVANKIIDVNHPLTYKGISFFQSSYGLTGLVIKVTGPKGEIVHLPFNVKNIGEGSYSVEQGEALKTVSVGGKKLTVFIHSNVVPDYVDDERVSISALPLNPAALIMVNDRFPDYKGLDAWSKRTWLSKSKPLVYKDFKVELERVAMYTGLEVSQNPGLPVIYAGFLLLLMGIFMAFYITRKVIRVRVSPAKNGSSIIVGANSRGEVAVFDRDFERIRSSFS